MGWDASRASVVGKGEIQEEDDSVRNSGKESPTMWAARGFAGVKRSRAALGRGK